ncbi:MAG: DUF4139 domain-containing protein [Burkholderiales bacterium]|nr:DUF4139 domain-containing protein [Burkholderiales bacterium]
MKRLACARVLTLILATAAAGAGAQSAASRIERVTVYPGSATVERVARVAAGARTLTFACLPAALDVQSLHVSADATVRLGETAVLTRPRAQAGECASGPLDARIREIETQKDALAAENDALALVTGYLKGLGGGDDGRRAAPDAKAVAATAEQLRRSGQDALLRQRQIARRQVELDRDLAPLLAERERAGAGGDVVSVSVNLAAGADAEVRLGYRVAGPSWTPAYRATLDSASGQVAIERQALVAQATGEDWKGVRLTLSTGQPRSDPAGRLPQPWRIGVAPPPEPRRAYAAAPAPAAMMAMERSKTSDAAPATAPIFDVTVFDQAYATEFALPQAIDLPSSGQRVALVLGRQAAPAKVYARTAPQIEAAAYVVAELPVPTGVWPAGPLQLYRDGAYVGNSRWDAGAAATLTLPFGRDEQLRVAAEPGSDSMGSGGFIGGRAERRIQRAWRVENRHRQAVKLQLIEAAPVSVDEQVKVTSAFQPQPAETAWHQQPGVAMWSIELAAGQTARVAADYVVSYPKDVRVEDR